MAPRWCNEYATDDDQETVEIARQAKRDDILRDLELDETYRSHTEGDADGLGAVRGIVNIAKIIVPLAGLIMLGVLGWPRMVEAAIALEGRPSLVAALAGSMISCSAIASWVARYRDHQTYGPSRFIAIVFGLFALRAWLFVAGY